MGTIIQHLDAIEHREIVLPEFQREYVWNLEQAKQLMVSLYRGYPTGSLLFWDTVNPPEIKNNAIPKNYIGRIRVLLDGQQRLTTLYLLLKGAIPPYYTERDITHDPRNLHFHLLRGEFEYPSKERSDPLWIKVVDFFGGKSPNIFELAQEHSRGVEPMKFAQQLNTNIMTLEGIKNRDYPFQTVPTSAGIEDAIDVFDRVNSLGTSLTKAELALTHMSGKWPDIRRVFKKKLDLLAHQGFKFTLDFLVRCITGIVTEGALYERTHKVERGPLEAAWKTLDKVLDTLVGILRGRAYIHSTDDLSTANVLVPIVVYLARHNGKFKSDKQARRFLYWMYQALLWGRYSGRTDETLERDINHILREDDPVDALLNEIVDLRGRLDLRPVDLEGRGIDHPAFRIMHIVAKSQGAVDWFNGEPLAGNSFVALRREMIANGINRYLASLLDERIPVKVFPQIAKLKDTQKVAAAREAVSLLTLEKAHDGLFKLGRLFESVLKEYAATVEQTGAYPISKQDQASLNNMIQWVGSRGIVSDAAVLHVLRQVRNDQAHPSLEEKRTTLNTAASIAGIYLDYILFFCEQREKLLATAEQAVS